MKQILFSGQDLTQDDFEIIVRGGARVEIAEELLAELDRGEALLLRIAKTRVVYGVNSGYGPMATHAIPQAKRAELQRNLIRSHALGMGTALSPEFVRATMAARLRSLLTGKSGVGRETPLLLAAMLNKKIHPVIPEHGGVGASGDLVQLAHVALAMLGEGFVLGRKRAAAALSAAGLKPLKPRLREGIAMLNGTSAMTGIAMLNVAAAQRFLKATLAAGCLLQEVAEGYSDSWSTELNGAKKHPGQRRIAQAMGNALNKSGCVLRHDQRPAARGAVYDGKVQDCYSVRCLPQVLGPILETIENAERVVTAELNSASDNPIVDIATQDIFHGGNFHGEYVAVEMDKLKIAITKATMLCDRQLNFLLNDQLNGLLPPFLNRGTLGLNLGLQGIQFTATSTTAESQTLAFPMSVHSIPSNKENQDIVSMGANAALMTARVLENAWQVLAIECVALARAAEIRGITKKMSPQSRALLKLVRAHVPDKTEDTIAAEEVSALVAALRESNFAVIE